MTTTNKQGTDYATELRPAFDTFIGVLNSRDYKKLNDAFTDNFRRVAPDFNANSRDEMIAGMRKIHEAYPDFKIVVNDASFSKDLGFCQWTVTGTATAPDGTKSPIKINGATMMRYSGGKIAEEHVFYDTAEFARQTGTSDIPHAH
jgi:hypothetical protein